MKIIGATKTKKNKASKIVNTVQQSQHMHIQELRNQTQEMQTGTTNKTANEKVLKTAERT